MESGKLALIDRWEYDYGIKRCQTASNSMGAYWTGDYAPGREWQRIEYPASAHFKC